ncbi:MAG: hypothetical protein CL927_04470 [Deltaproteobacteria bacterium]|nr:hypothetical protein [Deltaproteobacteria bacterium]HCH61356.1 hypothetical protein [Deltaproteobacteria bacterium]
MSRSDEPSGILVEIRQGGRLLAALPLGTEPIEVTLRDIRSGLPLGTLSAKGPARGQIDEQPLPRLTRAPEDDITMPLPERPAHPPRWDSDRTGDLDAEALETETAEAPRSVARLFQQVPNLAQNIWGHTTEEATSPTIPTATGHFGDHSDSLTIPRSTPQQTGQEATLSGALEPMETSEETISGLLEYVGGSVAVPPAEVWVRNASEWRSAGRLPAGQSARSRQGWVRLDENGDLVVHPGPELHGTATMADGTSLELEKGASQVRLPAGSSVILRGTGHGLYVRTDPPLPSF